MLLNQAAQRKAAVAFLIGGKPHVIGQDKSAEVLKSLNSMGFEYYYGAEQKGWILYLEGETDLRILHAFAERLQHPAKQVLENPLVKYMGTDKSHRDERALFRLERSEDRFARIPFDGSHEQTIGKPGKLDGENVEKARNRKLLVQSNSHFVLRCRRIGQRGSFWSA